MTGWIISSSALILVIVLIRRVLRGRMSLRLQYALWGLVLIRLLLPFSFFESGFSIMNLADKAPGVELMETAEELQGMEEIEFTPIEPTIPTTATDNGPLAPSTVGSVNGYYPGDSDHAFPTQVMGNATAEEFQQLEKAIKARDILIPIWLIGAILMAAYFLFTNLRFSAALRRSRRERDIPGSIIPVYVSGMIPTPCLFGLLRPAVYITPDCETDEATLRHVLAHEFTHYRHGDNIWAVLRCAALAFHWYNPLVWWAAVLSKRDGELACDEGAIRRLGEDERTPYGRTLIGMTCRRSDIGALAHTATTMTGSKAGIKERVMLIAKKPKMAIYTLVAVILIAAVTAACTFSGADSGFTDREARKEALPLAQSTTAFSGLSVIDEPEIVRSDDGKTITLIYPLENSKRTVEVVFEMCDDSGTILNEPYRAGVIIKSLIVSAEDIPIPSDALETFDEAVTGFARETVMATIEEYEGLTTQFTEAEISSIEQINTGTAALDYSINMYRVDFRLCLDNPAPYVEAEDAWLSPESQYIILLCEEGDGESVWTALASLTADELENFNHPLYDKEYGDKFTAACMEIYKAYTSENDDPVATVKTSANPLGIEPYLLLLHSTTWMGDGWLYGDGMFITPELVASVADKAPSITYDEGLRIIAPYGFISPPQVFSFDDNYELIEWISTPDDYELPKLVPGGNYYVAFSANGKGGDYIASEGRRESTSYNCIFRLEVASAEADTRNITRNFEDEIKLVYILPNSTPEQIYVDEFDMRTHRTYQINGGISLEDYVRHVLVNEPRCGTMYILNGGDANVQEHVEVYLEQYSAQQITDEAYIESTFGWHKGMEPHFGSQMILGPEEEAQVVEKCRDAFDLLNNACAVNVLNYRREKGGDQVIERIADYYAFDGDRYYHHSQLQWRLVDGVYQKRDADGSWKTMNQRSDFIPVWVREELSDYRFSSYEEKEGQTIVTLRRNDSDNTVCNDIMFTFGKGSSLISVTECRIDFDHSGHNTSYTERGTSYTVMSLEPQSIRETIMNESLRDLSAQEIEAYRDSCTEILDMLSELPNLKLMLSARLSNQEYAQDSCFEAFYYRSGEDWLLISPASGSYRSINGNSQKNTGKGWHKTEADSLPILPWTMIALEQYDLSRLEPAAGGYVLHFNTSGNPDGASLTFRFDDSGEFISLTTYTPNYLESQRETLTYSLLEIKIRTEGKPDQAYGEALLRKALTLLEDGAADKETLLLYLPFIDFGSMEYDDYFDLMDTVEALCLDGGQDSDQLFRNLLCMSAALNTDGAYTTRVQIILNKLYEYDKELYMDSLECFSKGDGEMLLAFGKNKA